MSTASEGIDRIGLGFVILCFLLSTLLCLPDVTLLGVSITYHLDYVFTNCMWPLKIYLHWIHKESVLEFLHFHNYGSGRYGQFYDRLLKQKLQYFNEEILCYNWKLSIKDFT